jgi:intraflagellar transport protein 122
MNDPKALVTLYASAKRWDDAFAVANRHPDHLQELYVPYAHWLVEQDRFQDAQARRPGAKGEEGQGLAGDEDRR